MRTAAQVHGYHVLLYGMYCRSKVIRCTAAQVRGLLKAVESAMSLSSSARRPSAKVERERRAVPLRFFCTLLREGGTVAATLLRHGELLQRIERTWFAAMMMPAAEVAEQPLLTKLLRDAAPPRRGNCSPPDETMPSAERPGGRGCSLLLSALGALPPSLVEALGGREGFVSKREGLVLAVVQHYATALPPNASRAALEQACKQYLYTAHVDSFHCVLLARCPV